MKNHMLKIEARRTESGEWLADIVEAVKKRKTLEDWRFRILVRTIAGHGVTKWKLLLLCA